MGWLKRSDTFWKGPTNFVAWSGVTLSIAGP